MAAALAHPLFGLPRLDGYASVEVVGAIHHCQHTPISHEDLALLEPRIRSSHNRDSRLQLDGFSRFFDLECLSYLI